MLRHAFLMLLLASVGVVARHPANVPVARAKITLDGKIDLKVRFDILAYVVDQTPADVTDPPMNALLDGPSKELQTKLTEAEARFKGELSVVGGEVDAIRFPTAEELHKQVDGGPKTRLPVMMTVALSCHLKKGETRSAFRFPEVLGTVILTTEYPFMEPISEPVEPGDSSEPHPIPTQKQVDDAQAAVSKHLLESQGTNEKPTRSEALAQKQIQAQYDAWSKAYMANDVEKLLALLTPDYTLKTATNLEIQRSEYAAMLQMRKDKHADTATYSTKILRITLYDNVAALFSRESMVTKQPNEKTGKIETIDHTHDYLDTWVFAKGKWLLRSTVTQREQTKIR